MARGDDQERVTGLIPRKNPFKQIISKMNTQQERDLTRTREGLRLLDNIPIRSGWAHNPLDRYYYFMEEGHGVAIETDWENYYPSILADITTIHGGTDEFLKKAGIDETEVSTLWEQVCRDQDIPSHSGCQEIFSLGLSLGLVSTARNGNKEINLEKILKGQVPQDIEEITISLATAKPADGENLETTQLKSLFSLLPLQKDDPAAPPGFSPSDAQRVIEALIHISAKNSPNNQLENQLAFFASEHQEIFNFNQEEKIQAERSYLAGLWSGMWLHYKKRKDF